MKMRDLHGVLWTDFCEPINQVIQYAFEMQQLSNIQWVSVIRYFNCHFQCPIIKARKKVFFLTIAYKTDIIKKWIKNREDIMKIWYIREIFGN